MKDKIDTFRERGTPKQLKRLCVDIFEGTNWQIANALRLADYFEELAKEDDFRKKEWTEISEEFESMAHGYVNDIESDHLLFTLLTIPLYDTTAKISVIDMALEQRRVDFLNNKRILNIEQHMWYHGASLDIEDDVNPKELSFYELLAILFFTPFKFYMSPIGFNSARVLIYVLYFIYVLTYSYYTITGDVGYKMDCTLWALAFGYVWYEIQEFLETGRKYFKVLSNFEILSF